MNNDVIKMNNSKVQNKDVVKNKESKEKIQT